MKAVRDLTSAERAIGCHNAPVGDYRLRTLQRRVASLDAGA